MKNLELANIDWLLNAACNANTITQLNKVIGRCLRNPFESVNELGRSLIKDLNKKGEVA